MRRSSFDQDWFVQREGDRPGPLTGPVTLPYDAMLTEERDPNTPNVGHTGYYPGGVYRYSKSFLAPQEWRDRVVIVEFEGVYHRSQVWVNGRLAGGRPSGYVAFQVRLDDFLVYGEQNRIEVVANNDDMPNARWYTGSGIYRPVHLLAGDRTHIAADGVRVSTTSIDGTTAVVKVETTIANDATDSRSLTVLAALTAPDGRQLATASSETTVAAGERTTLEQEITVPDALLWSPETPLLHVARVSIATGGVEIDASDTEFGIRVVTADSRKGLQINRRTVKLRGACIHHDNGVIGANTLDAAEDRRVRILKESGYNAIRSAHNPASRALLRACDRHGVLVMDELTDAWTRPKVSFDYSLDFLEWWERDLEALVANVHNHPSVVMYSIGNEIAETATPGGIALNRAMAKKTRELDPSRLVTNGINGFLNLISPQDEEKLAAKAAAARESGEDPNKNLIGILNLVIGILDRHLDRLVRLKTVDKRTSEAFADLDVAGYNYLTGRYELDAKLHPERVIVGSETRSANSVKIWKQIKSMPHVIGDFTWTGWDYIGEAGLATKQYGTTKRSIYHPYPALLAGEPLIDITGFLQTQAHVNRIAWGLTKGPHIAVEPVNHSGEKVVQTGWRATNSLDSWSWEGCEGREATVEVYADADRVELVLNGRSVGTAPAERDGDYLATFTLPYEPGELTAIAYDATGAEIGRRTLVSAGPGLRLDVAPEATELVADGQDLAFLPIVLTDDAGVVRPLADRSVTVTVQGPATLQGLGSAEAITREGFVEPSHRTFNGRALAVIRSGHDTGDVTVTISANGVAPVQVPLRITAPTLLGTELKEIARD